MRYECPFCYKTMPECYVPSAWSCCGEVGHAVAMPSTPRTDAAAIGFARILIDHERQTTTELVEANFARQLERELNSALIVAGVASLERGEWAAERNHNEKDLECVHARI